MIDCIVEGNVRVELSCIHPGTQLELTRWMDGSSGARGVGVRGGGVGEDEAINVINRGCICFMCLFYRIRDFLLLSFCVSVV